MKLYKILAFTLVLTFVFTLFACGKKNTPAVTTAPVSPTTEPPVTTEPNSTTVPPTTEQPYDLYDWIVEENPDNITGTVRFVTAFKRTQGVQEMIDAFNLIYPNITVEPSRFISSAELSGLSVGHPSRPEDFDVMASFGLNYTTVRWRDGWFMDITDMLTEDRVDMVTNWGTDAYQYNERYYTIPCGGLQYYVTINTTVWEEAGLGDIPTQWTWDEYIEACRKMTKTNEDGSIRYGGSSYSSINTILYCGAQVSGGDLYFNTDGTVSNYDDPVVIKAFERELNAELTEKIWFPLATYRSQGIKDYHTFLTGQVASAVTCNIVRYIHDAAYEETSDFITAFSPFPTEEKRQANYMSGVHVYSHAGISSACENVDAAWAFLKWYSTYGTQYLTVVGHQSTWRGTNADDIINIIYGSEENAAKYIDVESFKYVIGRTDLPAFRESTSANAVKTYSKVTGFLKNPLMKALAGELTAEEAMKQAAEGANAYINQVLGK